MDYALRSLESCNYISFCSCLNNKDYCSNQPLRKHVCLNILRILPPKNENFQMKNSGRFHISAQNIDCEYLLKAVQTNTHNLCF